MGKMGDNNINNNPNGQMHANAKQHSKTNITDWSYRIPLRKGPKTPECG